jgi:hypothetical protein
MAYTCPLCGARYEADERCEDRFNLALAKEAEDPAYWIVHHLMVPAYMLQHNGYSRAGWLYSRALLAEFVSGDLSPAAARQRNRRALDSGNRDWSITRGPKLERFDQITWTRTMADVRLDDAESYRADVRTWATAVIADTAQVRD